MCTVHSSGGWEGQDQGASIFHFKWGSPSLDYRWWSPAVWSGGGSRQPLLWSKTLGAHLSIWIMRTGPSWAGCGPSPRGPEGACALHSLVEDIIRQKAPSAKQSAPLPLKLLLLWSWTSFIKQHTFIIHKTPNGWYFAIATQTSLYKSSISKFTWGPFSQPNHLPKSPSPVTLWVRFQQKRERDKPSDHST